MRKTCWYLLLICLALLTQACISEVKPILKQTNSDIPARIANQQKQIDRLLSSGEPKDKIIKEAQKKLDLVKTRYARMEAEGRLTDSEIRKLTGMLDESGKLLFKPETTKAKAPRQSENARKKNLPAPDQVNDEGERE